MRLLAPDSSRRVPWKNGLGSTLEVATDAAVPGGDWTWRLSIADVPSRAPFSAFPGIDRFIACLKGPGLFLEHRGARRSVPQEGVALPFPGEDAVTGEPAGPGVRDVNLMLRRDRWRGRMTLVRGRAGVFEAPLIVVHSAGVSGLLRAETPEGRVELEPGRTMVAGGRVDLAPAPEGAAAVCELHPVD